MVTKEQIVNDLLSADFKLDGVTDYRRVQAFVKDEYSATLSNKAVWAVINAVKAEGLQVIDFD